MFNLWTNFVKTTEVCPFVEFGIFPTFELFDLEPSVL